MIHFGFSYIGLIWLVMLFVPNIIWTKNKPIGYEEHVIKENMILLILERIGQVLVTGLVLIFKDFNISTFHLSSLVVLLLSFLLMVIYELYWIRYFKSEKTMQDYYSSYMGIPVAGAALPVISFFIMGLYGGNVFLLIAVVILGIGHIGIHLQHRNAIIEKKKSKLPIKIIKVINSMIGIAFVIIFIGYLGIRNITYIKAFAGAKNPVCEELYVDLNGQKQFIRVIGRDKNNPVMIMLHGGPASPDGMAAYAFMDDLLNDYTYITWDQRGCGRTYYKNQALDPDNKTATPEQLLEDIDDLVDYACKRFGKDKVTILGHSWGTVLATRYSLTHPEKIDKTICVGQVESLLKGDIVACRHAMKEAEKQGDDTSAMNNALEAYEKDPSLFTLMDLRTLTVPYNKPTVSEKAVRYGALSPYLGIDDMRWMFIDNSNPKLVYKNNPILVDYIFSKEVNSGIEVYGLEYKNPIYFITGEMDWTCPVSLARKYYQEITAPKKAFYEVKGCGHNPHTDNPKEVSKIIKSLKDS